MFIQNRENKKNLNHRLLKRVYHLCFEIMFKVSVYSVLIANREISASSHCNYSA